jgi:hypothetical protein
MKKEKKEFKKNKRLKTFLTIFFLTTIILTFFYISTIVFAWVGPKGHPPTKNVTFGDFCQKIYGGCSSAKCINPCTIVALGGTCGGGKVAYHDGSGGGLIAHSTDSDGGSGIQWGCRGKSVGTTSPEFGTGLANTNTIVNFHNNPSNFNSNDYYTFGGDYSTIGCNVSNNGTVAAKVCSDLSSGGYDDWYLPSRWELFQLYVNRVAIGGGFASVYYWSSTEYSTTYVWWVDFNTGSSNYGSYKDSTNRVRCVRSF